MNPRNWSKNVGLKIGLKNVGLKIGLKNVGLKIGRKSLMKNNLSK